MSKKNGLCAAQKSLNFLISTMPAVLYKLPTTSHIKLLNFLPQRMSQEMRFAVCLTAVLVLTATIFLVLIIFMRPEKKIRVPILTPSRYFVGAKLTNVSGII